MKERKGQATRRQRQRGEGRKRKSRGREQPGTKQRLARSKAASLIEINENSTLYSNNERSSDSEAKGVKGRRRKGSADVRRPRY